MKRCFLISIILFLLTLPNLFAQGMITDRPDFTESAVAISAKSIQIESGVLFSNSDPVSEFTYPTALARVGLGHNMEVRIGFNGWSKISLNDASETYLNDLLLEAKYQLMADDADIPAAILLVANLPTGDDEVSVEAAEIGLKLATGFDINNNLSLGINLGAISVEIASEREISSLASFSLGIGVHDKLGVFIETYAEMPQNASWQPVLDGGFTWLLSPAVQLDFYVGKGLNDHAADFLIGGGASFLLNY
ncbi:MAG: transporter [Calditrichaeota bacterium]|nr:MAG: transporter [Calditrichota bacterium]